MKNTQSLILQTGLIAAILLLTGTASAQITPERREVLKALRARVNEMPLGERASLSSGVRAVLAYAAYLDAGLSSRTMSREAARMQGQSIALEAALLPPPQPPIPPSPSAGPGGTTRVSNPAVDFAGSVFAGFAQNTTSTARCGNSVVVGFEDTGALLNSGGSSFDGVSASADGGNTFINLSLLNPGADPTNVLVGDPVIACSSPKVFYYASILISGTPPNAMTSVSLSTSANGGRNWGPPVAAITASVGTAFFDKPWVAVDPSDPLRLYISYTDADTFSVQLIHSNDGGQTWSAPVVLEQENNACQDFPGFAVATGSNVVVGPKGEVYVSFEVVPPQCTFPVTGALPREIHFTRSLDHGATFGPPTKLATVVGNGDASAAFFGSPLAVSLLEGGFTVNEYPQMAVDRSNGPSRGTLYVAWSDGKNDIRPDVMAGTGSYAYPDVVVVKSADKGLSFTSPLTVSPKPSAFTGPGRDQFFPGIAVDPTGKVAVCYYDRRNDPTNMSIDRYCSVSLNHGASWQDLRASSPSWLPNQADFISSFNGLGLGEYDTLATDFLLLNTGFFAAFQIQEDGNPNIVARKF